MRITNFKKIIPALGLICLFSMPAQAETINGFPFTKPKDWKCRNIPGRSDNTMMLCTESLLEMEKAIVIKTRPTGTQWGRQEMKDYIVDYLKSLRTKEICVNGSRTFLYDVRDESITSLTYCSTKDSSGVSFHKVVAGKDKMFHAHVSVPTVDFDVYAKEVPESVAEKIDAYQEFLKTTGELQKTEEVTNDERI